jgi:hypothetical protein
MKRDTILSICRLSFILIFLISISSASEGQVGDLKNPGQFLFPEFTTGRVTMRTGQGYDVLLNYNIVSEKINFIQQGKILNLANPNSVDTIFIKGRKFIPVEKVFYEVLSEKQYSLFVQHKAKIKQPPKRDSYGNVPETASSTSLNYLSTDVDYYKLADKEVIIDNFDLYWIRINDSMQSFREKSQLIKIFPDFTDEIKSYIRKEKIKFGNNNDIKKLVVYCNTLMK